MQVLRTDKIGTLSHSSGNIIMSASVSNPAYLTIGGRQYKITSNLSVALPAMSANNRYQVYAVQTAAVVSLVISQNENSVGPSGYGGWKLVGSLLANQGSPVAFGAFITIKGKPTTPIFNTGRIVFDSTTASPPGKPSSAVDSLLMQMNGDSAYLKYQYKHEAIAGGSTGGGNYLLASPTNLSFNTDLVPANTDLTLTENDKEPTMIGHGSICNTASQGVGYGGVYSSTRLFFFGCVFYSTRALWSSTYYDLQQTGVGMTLIISSIPINEWSNTPIEDR